MQKYSKQREALLTEIRSRKDHPTAEELYMSLRTVMPNYSLGTVYRNLAELCTNGYILKIASASGPERYDGCVRPHGHFTCVKCGKVYDIDGVYEKYINQESIVREVSAGGKNSEIESVDEIRIMLYGTCKSCAEPI